MNASAWIAIVAILAPVLLVLGIGWARLSSRLAVIESKLDDYGKRPPQWCIDQQSRCRACFEPREPTGVGLVGHA